MFDYHRVYLWYIPIEIMVELRSLPIFPTVPPVPRLPHGRVTSPDPRGMDEFAMGTGPPPAANIQQQLQDQVQRLGVIFWAGWGMVLFFGPEMVVKNVVTRKIT